MTKNICPDVIIEHNEKTGEKLKMKYPTLPASKLHLTD